MEVASLDLRGTKKGRGGRRESCVARLLLTEAGVAQTEPAFAPTRNHNQLPKRTGAD
jgi:hypothetical protein